MKILAISLLALAGLASAQTVVTIPLPPEPVTPRFFVALGAGWNEATDPHFASTGSFGVHIGDGIFSVTSLDTSSRLDPATGTRKTVSTLRTGAQKIITRQGPVTLLALGDVGAAVGGGNIVGSFSTGGTLAYSLPKVKDVFLYGSVRLIKSPQPEPVNPATVQTAVTIGIGFAFR